MLLLKLPSWPSWLLFKQAAVALLIEGPALSPNLLSTNLTSTTSEEVLVVMRRRSSTAEVVVWRDCNFPLINLLVIIIVGKPATTTVQLLLLVVSFVAQLVFKE